MADKNDVTVQDQLDAANLKASELLTEEAQTQGVHTDDAPQNDPDQLRKSRDLLDKEAEEAAKFRQAEKDKAAKKVAAERQKAEGNVRAAQVRQNEEAHARTDARKAAAGKPDAS